MHQPPPNQQQYQGQNQQYQGQQQQNVQYQQGQGQQQQNLQYQQGQGQQQLYQQPPQGHQNTQQFQQQPPPNQNQGHHGQHTFNQRENVHNQEHIKEHLKEVVDKPEKEMTDDELEFHYFKLHDYDGNNKLDGVEVTKAITHFHDEDEGKGEGEHGAGEGNKNEHKTPPKVYSDDELTSIIDMVMKEDDLNDDGYIEYFEFVTAQRKAKEGGDNKPT
ncbi:MCFD2 [Mytilus coruscus]|uniref:MCFD2 n=1 Tax=Mytilus coruscus TaxID=42192 RepID=A0A6J8CL36_MYTCO|nr:MCFD2 [Mytilus coruscus]